MMGDTVNLDSIRRDRKKNLYDGMSAAELDRIMPALEAEAKAEKEQALRQTLMRGTSNPAQTRKPSLEERIGGGMSTAGNILLQSAGITPPKQADISTGPDFYEKERYKQELKQSDPLYQAKIDALGGVTGDGSIPTDSTAGTDFSDAGAYSSMWQQIPEEERGYFMKEPAIQNIEGIPTTIGYKPVLTEEGKEYYKNKKTNERASVRVKDAASEALQSIGEVKKGIGYFGLTGGLPSIPGTSRATWEAYINKLLSKKIVNLMNDMKSASKTGATGFGQLSEKELELLQNAATALKRTMKPEDALKILDEMEAIQRKIIGGDQAGIPTQEQEPAQQEAQEGEVIVNEMTGEELTLQNGQWVAT